MSSIKLLTIQETARLLRMSRAGVTLLVKRKQLPAIEVPGPTPKRPGRILIDEEDLTEYVKERWKTGGGM